MPEETRYASEFSRKLDVARYRAVRPRSTCQQQEGSLRKELSCDQANGSGSELAACGSKLEDISRNEKADNMVEHLSRKLQDGDMLIRHKLGS